MKKEPLSDEIVACVSLDCIDYDNSDVILRLQSALAVLKRKTEENRQKQLDNNRDTLHNKTST